MVEVSLPDCLVTSSEYPLCQTFSWLIPGGPGFAIDLSDVPNLQTGDAVAIPVLDSSWSFDRFPATLDASRRIRECPFISFSWSSILKLCTGDVLRQMMESEVTGTHFQVSFDCTEVCPLYFWSYLRLVY